MRASCIHLLQSQRGVGLLEALIGLVLLLIAVYSTLGIFSNNAVVSRQLAQNATFNEVTELLRDRIMSNVGGFNLTSGFMETIAVAPATRCNAPPNPFSSYFPISDSNSGIRFDLIPASGAPFGSYIGDAAHQAAKSRCETRQTFNSGGVFSTQRGIYFCVNVVPTMTPNSSSILNTLPVFAEVYYALWDFEHDQPLQCANFAGIRGGQIYITLYWQTKVAGKTQYMNHFEEMDGPTTP